MVPIQSRSSCFLTSERCWMCGLDIEMGLHSTLVLSSSRVQPICCLCLNAWAHFYMTSLLSPLSSCSSETLLTCNPQQIFTQSLIQIPIALAPFIFMWLCGAGLTPGVEVLKKCKEGWSSSMLFLAQQEIEISGNLTRKPVLIGVPGQISRHKRCG